MIEPHEKEIHLLTKQQLRNQQSNRAVSILIFREDTKIVRHRKGQHSLIYRHTRKPRSLSKGFSKSSKRNLIFRLRNATCMKSFVTLTYPTMPQALTPLEFQAQRKKLIRSLTSKQISGFIIAESQAKDNGLHYHLIIDKEVTKEQMFELWSKVIGYEADSKHFKMHGVHVEDIYNQNPLASYLSKTRGKESELPVKYWSSFGKSRGMPSHKLLNGTAKDLAKVVRNAKKLDVGKRRRKSKNSNGRLPFKKIKDNGKNGRVIYDVSKALREHLHIKDSVQDCG